MTAGPTDRGTGTAPAARRAARVLCLDPDGALPVPDDVVRLGLGAHRDLPATPRRVGL